jgi:peptidoglycan hydrolase CwlO-like protein
MARSQIRSADALKKVRERQRELDREDDERREARRKRIAEASATALVALGRYEDAVAALDEATAEVGDAVRTLMAEDVDADRAAALLELDAAEVRRFAKAAAEKPAASSKTGSGATAEATVTPMAGRAAGQQRPSASSSDGTDASRRIG